MRRTGSSSSCPALLCPLVPLFHFCVWVTVWVRNFWPTHKVTFCNKKSPKPKFSGIFGAATQIRTGDLILTKRLRNFFLTIFNVLWPYPLHSVYFLSLSKIKVSAHSAALCGNLCGQTVGGVDFRDLTICTNVVRTRFSVCPTFLQSTAKHFAMVLTMMRDVKGISILSH